MGTRHTTADPSQGGGGAPAPLLLESELQSVAFDGPILARGGAATIYALAGWPQWVAKVYHRPTAEHGDRLAAMVANPPGQPEGATGHAAIAWPVDRLLAAGAYQDCRGYVMPRADRARSLAAWLTSAPGLAGSPLADHATCWRVAHRLAAAVRCLHARGHVVGSLDAGKVLVDPQGRVTLADTDSFQVAHDGRLYPCRGGHPAYTPPELQGGAATGAERRPEHDAFALAVLIHQLLAGGRLPFVGRSPGQGPVTALDGSSPVLAAAPPQVQALFRACFEQGARDPALRPGAARWEQELQEIEKELIACPVEPRHRYYRLLDACPWCRAARAPTRHFGPSSEEDFMSSPAGKDDFELRVDTTLELEMAQGAGAAAAPTPPVFAPDPPQAAPPGPTPGGVPVFAPAPRAGTAQPPAPGAGVPVHVPQPQATPPPAPVQPPRASSLTPLLLVLLLVALVGGGAYFVLTQGLGRTGNAKVAEGPKKDNPTGPETPVKTEPGAPAVTRPEPQVVNKPLPPPVVPVPARAFLSTRDTLADMLNHLRSLPAADRKFQRYFTLVHLHNNSKVSEEDLRTCRSALEKLLGALSAGPAPVAVRPVDPGQTILHVDLRTLGWDRSDVWRELLKAYPYGLRHGSSGDDLLAERARQVYSLSGSELPYLRADWFVAAATRPPLYGTFTWLAGKDANEEPDPRGFPPPIPAAAGKYRKALGLEEAAFELGLRDPETLRDALKQNPVLRKSGLAPLAEGWTFPRETWETVAGLTSPFQDAAYELELGTPYRVRR